MPPPLARLGVVADIQYVDLPDGHNFARTVRRKYRGSLEMLKVGAVPFWNSAGGVDCVLQLGDIIDGQCATSPKLDGGASGRALANVMSTLGQVDCGIDNVHHLIGNHELYNFDRETLRAAFGMDGRVKNKLPPPGALFYAFAPCRGYRILVLDAFHEALIGRSEGSPEYQNALAALQRHNPNDVLKEGVNWTTGLDGLNRRFVPYNGALGETQLKWLEGELRSAEARGDRVVILSHALLHPRACDGSTMCFDCDRALAILDRFPSTVVAVLAGHDHNGGYYHEKGCHHITFKSPLNKGVEGACFGVVELYDGAIRCNGPDLRDLVHRNLLAAAGKEEEEGPVRSLTLQLPPRTKLRS